MKSLAFFLTILLTQPLFATELKFLNEPGAEKSGLPFSKATQVGNLLFLSGELGIDPKTKRLVKGGIEAESQQVMKNIAKTLKLFGSDLSKVAKCTVFLADIEEWSKFNQVYVTFFKENFPARSAVAGSGLALSARVEVECIAVI
jgi:2-iminobutanoate/2-iminopropanoate deaminase